MKRTLLFLFFTFSFSSIAQSFSSSECLSKNLSKMEAQKTWENPQWLGLLHMREGWFSPESEVDGKYFFISPEGSHSSKSELISTLNSFCANSDLETGKENSPKMKVQCRFPARAQWLSQQGFGGWESPQCPALETWKSQVGKEEISLVFSSYYANNPSSVFGHTLLRVDKKKDQSNSLVSPLLSYGINYAAEANTSNGLLYALLGMTGGFPGVYTSLPYYYKVREYSDFDSRDLWEYQLNMNEEQKNLLLNHIWEQGFTYFDYFYFTENCSYHLLTSLDVALPELELDQKIPYWVIPIDTVKALASTKGLVKEVKFRPSLYRQYRLRLDRLESKDLKEAFYQTLEGHPLPESLSPQDQALVMDTVLDYWDFKHAKELLDPKSNPSKVKMNYLRTRAKLPQTDALNFDKASLERPDQSHETFRAGLGFVSNSVYKTGGLNVDLRFALHDFLDPQLGYPKKAQVQFMKFNGTHYFSRNQFKLNEVILFDVELLSPLRKLENSFSWRAKVGGRRDSTACDHCLSAQGFFQGGGTLGFFQDRFLVYALGGADVRSSDQFESDHFLALPAASLGFLIKGPYDLTLQSEGTYLKRSVYGLSDLSRVSVLGRKNFGISYSLGVQFEGDFSKEISHSQTGVQVYTFF
ncbi:MAG TPA: hypothetical protein DCL41_09885 [Bdellovibrionales bacterium]|nr:hypothetical protein [Bdellovibrionales bacterium]